MAAIQLGRRAALPVALVTGSLLIPRGTLHAEEPSEPYPITRRKPIYDSDVPVRSTSTSSPLQNPIITESRDVLAAKESGYTSQLAAYVRRARLFTHAHVALAERKFNSAASRLFALENDITSTIASLAPDPRTGEKVLPGALYVVVAGMAGSIVTRNRNILLRATAPLVFAVGASNYLLPHTSRNVGDLVWRWEQRFPVIADNHLRARDAVRQSVRDVQQAGVTARAQVDKEVRRARETLEGWVQQGR